MDEVWGPMTAQELALVARRGRLTRDDLVRQGEKGTWVRAEIVAGLFNADAPPRSAAPCRLSLEPSAFGSGQGEGVFSSVDHDCPPSIRAAIAVRPTPAKRAIAVSPAIHTKHHPAQPPASRAPTQYWISYGHHTAGPFTRTQIRQLAASGTLHPNHLIRNNQSSWVLARRVKGLTFPQAAPFPAGRIPIPVADANYFGVAAAV